MSPQRDGPSLGLFQCMLRAAFSSSPNFYILDEPTNHLDMETIEALAKALNKFRVSSLGRISRFSNASCSLRLKSLGVSAGGGWSNISGGFKSRTEFGVSVTLPP